jgi:hypothetical protein
VTPVSDDILPVNPYDTQAAAASTNVGVQYVTTWLAKTPGLVDVLALLAQVILHL